MNKFPQQKRQSQRLNALKIPSRVFCGPSFLLLCMETHDMMDLTAVKETGKYEFDKERKEKCVKNVTLMKIE